MSATHILVVDDEPDIRNLVQEILEDEHYSVSTAEDGSTAREALRASTPDLILLDIWMPDVDGITLLKEWLKEEQLDTPVVMMSGHGTVETAVEATRLGAYDFLEKPLSMSKLLRTVERALEAGRRKREDGERSSRPRHVSEPGGRSPLMQRLREQVKRIAQHDTWVLITGESGSGRETFARFLHSQSPRRERPFVDVRVSSTTRENATRELFGSEEGGELHRGALERAAGGTLFLDEVADMDREVQTQLLGALDSGSFLRKGGQQAIPIDVRVIAATQRNLEEEVQAGRFREDLFYHLNVVPLHIPALREHREDVTDLLNHYVDWFVAHEKLLYRHFNVAAQNYLRNYAWPGNIRELKNLVQRLLILGAGDEITQEEVEEALGGGSEYSPEIGSAYPVYFDQPLRQAREQFERAYLQYQLEKHAGNVSRLAVEAGMERTHLYRKLKTLGIEIKDRR